MKNKGWLKKLLLTLLIVSSCKAIASNSVMVLDIAGAIGPASADYFIRGLDQANQSGAVLVVLRLDTPGGLDKSMRQMIKAILASKIPVATYVTPKGSRAASAGTYILYASHIAAMTLATHLGAATPVQISTPKLPTMPSPNETEKSDSDKSEKDNASLQKNMTAMEKKIINDAVAYIKGLAQLRGRNIEWAIRAVRHAESLPASAALKLGVIDLIAEDLNDLLNQLDGKKFTIGTTSIELNTSAADITYIQSDWRNKFLAVITDPNVAYILMLLGIYGIILEFSNPGMALPGIVGAMSIMVALYAFQVLPISYAGLGLIILGILLMVGEAFSPSFGILGLGGIIAFIIGSIFLMDTNIPAYQIALPTILALALISAGLLLAIIGMAIRARKQTLVTGLSTLLGQSATVESIHHGQAMIRLDGELWQVNSHQALSIGDPVKVLCADGVMLEVQKPKENHV